jgi:transcriptional regulator with PAS, ATPase and Fis domain
MKSTILSNYKSLLVSQIKIIESLLNVEIYVIDMLEHTIYYQNNSNEDLNLLELNKVDICSYSLNNNKQTIVYKNSSKSKTHQWIFDFNHFIIPIKTNDVCFLSVIRLNNKLKKTDIEAQSRIISSFVEVFLLFINGKFIKESVESPFKNQFEIFFSLVDLINQGVFIFDLHHNLQHINKKSELLLGNNLAQLNYLKKINDFSIRKLEVKEDDWEVFTVTIRRRKIRIFGETHPIIIDNKYIGDIFIHQNIEQLAKEIYQTSEDKVYNFSNIFGTSKELLISKEISKKLSITDNIILVYGETGTGKEIFAKAIHTESLRRDKPFLTVACSGALESRLEEELFGENNIIELSREGTLFIDEISDMPMRLQGKLMNLIFRNKIKSRLIISTNKDLKHLVSMGEFRENLYYAIEATTITIPPLRKRQSDIIPLTNVFLNYYNEKEGKKVILTKKLYNTLLSYHWPGNIRELQNMVSTIISLKTDKSPVSLDTLPYGMSNKFNIKESSQFNLERVEKETITAALNALGDSQTSMNQVAKQLGISRATLYRKMNKYKIDKTFTFQ